MLACGHDAHVIRANGLAKAMLDLKSEWSDTLAVYGEPAGRAALA